MPNSQSKCKQNIKLSVGAAHQPFPFPHAAFSNKVSPSN